MDKNGERKRFHRLSFEFAVEADTIEEAVDIGADILECAQGKATLLNGDVTLAEDHPIESYSWGTLDGQPFRNYTAMRQGDLAAAGGSGS